MCGEHGAVMNSRIENESGGKYLYIETTAERDGFESKMAESVISENIITPNLVYAYGGMCLEYNITGLVKLDEYLSGLKLGSMDITRLIAQIEQCVNTIKNYLLSETDLLLDADYVYVDAAGAAIKFCIVPDYGGNFEHELKQLINKMLIHIDAEDDKTLRLGYKLFRAVSDDDCKLHDLMTVLKGSETGATRHHADLSANPTADSFVTGNIQAGGKAEAALQFGDTDAGYSDICDLGTETARQQDLDKPRESAYGGGIGAKPPQAETSTIYDDYGEEEEAKPRGLLRETLTGLLVSQAILIGVAAAVFLLKGRASVMRLIPVYLVIALCLTVYYVISFCIKRRQTG